MGICRSMLERAALRDGVVGRVDVWLRDLSALAAATGVAVPSRENIEVQTRMSIDGGVYLWVRDASTGIDWHELPEISRVDLEVWQL